MKGGGRSSGSRSRTGKAVCQIWQSARGDSSYRIRSCAGVICLACLYYDIGGGWLSMIGDAMFTPNYFCLREARLRKNFLVMVRSSFFFKGSTLHCTKTIWSEQSCNMLYWIKQEVDMMKKMLEIVMVALIVAVVAGAYFKWMGALPISVTQTQKMSTFDASGEGKVVVIPDQATVNMGVAEVGTNLKQVQEQVNRKMSSLTKALKEMGIAEKDIRTTGYNYYPDYNNQHQYRAYANVSVRIRDLENVSPAMDLIGSLGLDNVSGPSFGLSDELLEKSTKEARELAIGKAKAKAEELAGLAGMRLGRIVNVTEGSRGGYPAPIYARDAVVSGGAEVKVETPVEAGSSEVVVNVTLSYETR